MPTVLLVDDTDVVRGLMQVVLEREGYDVLAAASPNEAIDAARSTERIDLVVSDLVMPQMDAFELVERIRVEHPDVKVLYISGYADVSAEGAFLAKPFTPRAFAAAVAELAA
jgi:two-component system cell cycle sensor histidine kinase/response regulator CckA